MAGVIERDGSPGSAADAARAPERASGRAGEGGGPRRSRGPTIRTKVLLGFSCVLALLVVVAASGVASLLVVLGALDRHKALGERVEIAESLNARFLELRRHAREFSFSGDSGDATRAFAAARILRTDIERARTSFTAAERLDTLEDLSRTFEGYLANFATGRQLQEAEEELIENQLDAAGLNMMGTLAALLDSARRQANAAAIIPIRDAREHTLQARLYANIYLGRRGQPHGDPAYGERTKAEFREIEARIAALEAQLTAPEDRLLLDGFKVSADAYRQAFAKVAQNEDEIRRLFDERMAEQAESIGHLVDRLRAGIKRDAEATKADAEARERTARFVMLAFAAGGLVLGVAFAWLLGDGISAPVAAMTAVLERLAKGDYAAEIPARERGDEIGRMAAAAHVFKETAIDNVRLAAERERAVERSEADRRQLAERLRDLAEAQARLLQANDALLRSNKELDDFAYIASHDLKEPLRGIHNYASFLIEDYGARLDEEGRRRLETLMRLTRRMEGLIDNLLAYSRLGRTELAIRETDLDRVVRDVVEETRIWLDGQGVEVRMPERLPKLLCDAVRVGEVFRNLISNAAKYNDKSEKWVEIGVRNGVDRGRMPAGTAADERQTVFYVRDNGIGIPEKHRERVFQIFKRLHGRDKYGGGSGVGMSIARKIVERHGGDIWIESEPGVGTTVLFTLGAAAAREAA
jgi:signal transduction histidine kinase